MKLILSISIAFLFSCMNHAGVDNATFKFRAKLSDNQTIFYSLEVNPSYEIIRRKSNGFHTTYTILTNLPCYFCCEELEGSIVETEEGNIFLVEYVPKLKAGEKRIVSVEKCTMEFMFEVKEPIKMIEKFEFQVKRK